MICLQFCLKINHANVKEKNDFTPTNCAGSSSKKYLKYPTLSKENSPEFDQGNMLNRDY